MTLRIQDRAVKRTLIALGVVALGALVRCTEKTPFAGLAEAPKPNVRSLALSLNQKRPLTGVSALTSDA